MKSKILLVLSILMGLLFVNGGLDKFFHYMPQPEGMTDEGMGLMMAFDGSGWLLPLIGLGELIGGVLLIVPKTRALGAVVLFPIMAGILCFHLVQEPAGLPIAFVMLAIHLWIILENRDKYMHMIG